MSGLIFSLLLGAAAIASLMKVLKEGLGFNETAEGRELRGYVNESGYHIRVFVKRDDRQVQFILPDLSIPDEVCKRAVKKLTAELYAMIPEKEVSPDNILVVGPSHSFCEYCLEPAKEMLFRCWRCHGLYCGKHRFPEEHECPSGDVTKTEVRRERKERKKKEVPVKVLLKEVPCG